MKSNCSRQKVSVFLLIALSMTMLIGGCGRSEGMPVDTVEGGAGREARAGQTADLIELTSDIIQLEAGLTAVRYEGDYGFDEFLSRGGASSDREVVEYLANNLLDGFDIGTLIRGIFGCSTLSACSPDGEVLFGRNFDWNRCEAMVVVAHPENGYASISTVNMDFITQNIGSGLMGLALKLDEAKTLAALYAPLDGMNEQGLAVSVNMIQDSANIEQQTGKPDITTTTAVRLLLDKAANVEEALELLGAYDLHGSMGMMIHFALADSTGRSVAVEYIDNEMVVTETPVVTNFYLAQGDKYGIGTQQSHERYDILMDRLDRTYSMDIYDVRDALDSVSKDNFEEFASTEWSIVFNLSTGEAHYYHRENYQHAFSFAIE